MAGRTRRWRRRSSTSASTPSPRPSAISPSAASRCGGDAGRADVRRARPDPGRRAGGGDRRGADGRVDGSRRRGEGADLRRHALLVAPASGSYVAGLLAKGEAAVCRKIGEEAIEVVTAALGGEGDARVVSEVADLWFHTLVLLGERGIPLRDVLEELARRHRERAASRGSRVGVAARRAALVTPVH